MINILGKDLFLNALGFCLLVLILMLPWLNPPAAQETATPPGHMSVSITWPEGNTDIDLWIKCPDDAKPIGYSNRGGHTCNLLRDDLGNAGDSMPLNYENAYSRGLPAGEYVVNLHLFRGAGPIPVSVEILFGQTGKQAELFLKEVVDLRSQGQERTVIRFRIDGNGKVVSTNRVFKPLRAAKQ